MNKLTLAASLALVLATTCGAAIGKPQELTGHVFKMGGDPDRGPEPAWIWTIDGVTQIGYFDEIPEDYKAKSLSAKKTTLPFCEAMPPCSITINDLDRVTTEGFVKWLPGKTRTPQYSSVNHDWLWGDHLPRIGQHYKPEPHYMPIGFTQVVEVQTPEEKPKPLATKTPFAIKHPKLHAVGTKLRKTAIRMEPFVRVTAEVAQIGSYFRR